MQQLLLSLCLFIAVPSLQAQQLPKRTFRVQLGLPVLPSLNVHMENRIGRHTSLVAKIDAVTQFSVSSSLGTTGSVAYVPSAELRWYYNVERRLEKGKSIRYFSGNFFSAEPFVKAAQTPFGNYMEYLPPLYPEAGLLVNYGLQRGFGQHGHWGLCLGITPVAVMDGQYATVVKINFQLGLQW
ncbi:hypothetical protein [Chitinophaga alhagiae]|uniref:hypothetical protein n=1 Tax=Chitinophaga alhagiae TaxID=2203219 RepID=UPI000E5A4A76|nr:hypothetical protein [Chitinophaga alhagiae]